MLGIWYGDTTHVDADRAHDIVVIVVVLLGVVAVDVFVVVVVVVVVPSRVAPNPPPCRELKNDLCASMSLVMIKTATAVNIYMGNTTTTNVKRKDERSDGKKKALLEKS